MSEYDTDILTWSERQASLPQRLSMEVAGSGNELDWPHIIEEIEAVRRSELRAVESLLFQMFVRILNRGRNRIPSPVGRGRHATFAPGRAVSTHPARLSGLI